MDATRVLFSVAGSCDLERASPLAVRPEQRPSRGLWQLSPDETSGPFKDTEAIQSLLPWYLRASEIVLNFPKHEF